jgi:hypothetical protein
LSNGATPWSSAYCDYNKIDLNKMMKKIMKQAKFASICASFYNANKRKEVYLEILY